MSLQPASKLPPWSPDLYARVHAFAARAHQGQRVPGSRLPYLTHVQLVAMEVTAALALEPGRDGDLAVACALLHDVLEDTAVKRDHLEERFGAAVAAGVQALSKDPQLPKEQQLADSLARIRSQPREVWLVKLADRITNLAPPPAHWSRAKAGRYRREAQLIHETLAPASPYLAGRLWRRIQDYRVHTGEPA